MNDDMNMTNNYMDMTNEYIFALILLANVQVSGEKKICVLTVSVLSVIIL